MRRKDYAILKVTLRGPFVGNLISKRRARAYLIQAIKAQLWALLRVVGKPQRKNAIVVELDVGKDKNPKWLGRLVGR